jgi:hypothetical protein
MRNFFTTRSTEARPAEAARRLGKLWDLPIRRAPALDKA